MAVKMTRAGLIAKWVVVPAVLALLGYFVVGPNLGKVAGGAPKSEAGSANEPPNADPPAAAGASTTASAQSGPDVTVDVHKLKPDPTAVAADAPHPPSRKHHKTAAAPSDAASATQKPPSANEPPAKDEGGSAGATTAG